MLSTAFCVAKAEECEDIAADKADERQRDEWLLMADDWVVAAMLGDEQPPSRGGD